MQTMGLFEAKNKLSELVERASQGQKTGITRRGKLAALIVPARPEVSVKEIFDDIEQMRSRAKMPKGASVRDLIEEGRV
ncbi:MAG: type II toxin-antitoxin system Phd/YefM family antitoxin [Terriglobia bacterium]